MVHAQLLWYSLCQYAASNRGRYHLGFHCTRPKEKNCMYRKCEGKWDMGVERCDALLDQKASMRGPTTEPALSTKVIFYKVNGMLVCRTLQLCMAPCIITPHKHKPLRSNVHTSWIPKQGSLLALHRGSKLFIVGPLQCVSGSTGWNDIYEAPWARGGKMERDRIRDLGVEGF